MVNSNPETVSTDYDTSDRLFFEPLTAEDVLNICDRVQPDGRDRPVRRPDAAEPGPGPGSAGVPIIGTSPETIDLAEDREQFRLVIDRLGLKQPPNASRRTMPEARDRGGQVGYPVAGAAELRPRRPGDGDRLRRARSSSIS